MSSSTPSSVPHPKPKLGEKPAEKPGVLQPVSDDGGAGVFSKVFLAKPGSGSDSAPGSTTTPTPFKVFSRPPEQSVFTPFKDGKGVSLGEDVAAPPIFEIPEEYDENGGGEGEGEIGQEEEEREDIDVHTPEIDSSCTFQHQQQEQRAIPLGGRFGQFNIMTPITERTFEWTSSSRGMSATPSVTGKIGMTGRGVETPYLTGGRGLGMGMGTPSTMGSAHGVSHNGRRAGGREGDAVREAERLAAEVRDGLCEEELEQEEEQEEEGGDGQGLEQEEEQFGHERVQEEYDSSFSSFDEEHELEPEPEPEDVKPFRVSDGHTIHPLTPDFNSSPNNHNDIHILTEKTRTLSLLDALTLASSFKPPNPCNPFSTSIVSTLLSLIPVHGNNSGLFDLREQEAGVLEGLQKFAQKQARKSGNTGTSMTRSSRGGLGSWGGGDGRGYEVTLDGRKLSVVDKLGEGGFGAVFAAKEVKEDDEEWGLISDNEDDDEDEGPGMVAIKIVKPANLWEFHILRRIHYALPPPLRRSIVHPHALYAFKDESFLILDLCPQGTLLDIVNRAGQAGFSQPGGCLDELLVVFFTVELLRIMDGLHTTGFIHGDLKIDNCLLRLEDVPGGLSALSSVYSPKGEDGWNYKGVKLIDFGRTIEVGLFPAGQTFVADWPVDAKDCLEMREDRAWTFQADYYGLAGVVYCLLFGKYIETSSVTLDNNTPPRYKISTPFKRYWQSSLWMRLFDILLNPCLIRADGSLPLCEELSEVRIDMEDWLKVNCNRSSGTLKGLLKKIEVSVYSR